ncbi:hypothetical protein HOF56_04610 [Candidatus Peribacteria bacterium]|jgi:hypothetical protein|nr:hypothetical protein [Candidatus Peribacteria bacterium]MBT4021246.1 hypothetical protein [Candidatus Peribacteria bacterium]
MGINSLESRGSLESTSETFKNASFNVLKGAAAIGLTIWGVMNFPEVLAATS